MGEAYEVAVAVVPSVSTSVRIEAMAERMIHHLAMWRSWRKIKLQVLRMQLEIVVLVTLTLTLT
jgi:hypothetical protein